MVIKTILLPSVATNCYVVADENTKHCAIIDPGAADPHILETVRSEGWEVQYILLTHAHYDHTRGIPALRPELPGVPVYVHPGDAKMPKPFFFIEEMGKLTFYEDGDHIKMDSVDFEVLHTPGHTAGSVVLRVGDTLFTGDTLFKGSMGRTDLPGGSYEDMKASLKRLGALEGDLTVLPGHMDPSTLDHERKYNFYLKEALESK